MTDAAAEAAAPYAYWPQYESHKVVRAAKIIGIPNSGDHLIVAPSDDATESFVPTEPAMIKRAELGGYAVIYKPDDKHPNGYGSVSPAKAFEDGYRPVAP